MIFHYCADLRMSGPNCEQASGFHRGGHDLAATNDGAGANSRPSTPRALDSFLNRLCFDGLGSCLDSRLHAGLENAGLFVRTDHLRLFGCNVRWLTALSRSEEHTSELQSH